MFSTLRRNVHFSILLGLGALASCEHASDPVAPVRPTHRLGVANVGGAPIIYIATVEELYDEVNDPSNSPAVIELAAGTYVLTQADGAGLPRPNGGRLELQANMSLYGVAGDRSAVVIDARGLPLSSLTASLGRTGPVRVGRGDNTIESLTILGNASAAGGIETDLAGTASTQIRVANVVSVGSTRGIDVRNIGPAMAGRRIDITLVGNEFAASPSVQNVLPNQGIRLVNMSGANGGVIVATLRGNRVHGSEFGCLVNNLASSNAIIQVQSAGDHFFENVIGCFIGGGIVTGTTGMANSNATTFEAHGSAFVDNSQSSSLFNAGGILVIGGESPNLANGTSYNTVTVRLWGATVARNLSPNVAVFGARSLTPGIAGTNNYVMLELNGVSKRIDVESTASLPPDASATNTVTVVR